MKEIVFSGLLIVAGAILISSSEISNSGIGATIGVPLILWGIAERIVLWLKDKKQK